MKPRIRLPPSVQAILHDVGLLLHVPGGMAIASLPICLWFDERYAVPAFLLTALVSFSLGQLLYRVFETTTHTRLRHAMMVAALSWGLIPLIGAIPFWMIASQLASDPQTSPTVLAFQNGWNAIFEAVSGFTSTGLTMALRESQLPRTLQWWRSLTEWVGGIGVVVLVLSILEPNTDSYLLYSAEGRKKRISLTVTATVRRIWWIYLFYTGVSILLLRLAGMPGWDAINHGLTAISIGGFSIRDDSLGSYSAVIQLATIVIMIAGAISFPVHYRLLTERQLSVLWRDSQHRALWVLLGLGTAAMWLETRWFSGAVLWLDSLFQWVSALATCGFETVDLASWSASAKLLLVMAMILGGTAGSNVGGLKLNRAVTLYKGVVWWFQRLDLQPHQLMRYQLEGTVFSEAAASRRIEAASVLLLLWLSAIVIGVLVLLHVAPTSSLSDLIFETTSALSSVGLSTGITSPDLSWVGKLTLMVLMWMGRLEIMPILVLVTALLRVKKR